MREITIPSSLIAPRAEKPLAPAMIAALWEVAAVLDEQRVAQVVSNAVWLEIPSRRLRGEGGRNDNHWLKQCLERLTSLKLSGEYKGEAWGAVIVAEWHITQGGTVVRILIPPAAVQALRAPATFARIETTAAHRLSGHARRLYAVLADKKRLRRPTWTYELDELRALLDLAGRRAYDRWDDFARRVLKPAVAAINDYGTVEVTMVPVKLGRAVTAVRFDWRWKSVDEARETDEENERHTTARRQDQPAEPDAPPMIEAPPIEPRRIPAEERAAIGEQVRQFSNEFKKRPRS